MQTRLRHFLLLVGLLSWPAICLGQVQQPKPPAAAGATPAIAPEQARQALDVLENPKSRDALITTLKAIAGVSEAAPAAPPAAPAAAPAATASKLPLAPDSLGAQLLSQTTAGLENAGAQFMASLRAVNDLPLLWRWLVGQVNDADARAAVIDAAWKLVVVIAAGLAAEAGGRLLLRRLRDALSQAAQSHFDLAHSDLAHSDLAHADLAHDDRAGAAAQVRAGEDDDPPGEARENQRVASAHRLAKALATLRRLPFLFAKLLLDLAPLALFIVVTDTLVGTRLGDPASTRGTILLVVQCYSGERFILALAALLVSPSSPALRLLHVSDWAAEFLTRWIQRVTIIGVTGYCIAGVGLQFNMYLTAYDTLLKLFALAVHICIVVAILEAREPVSRRIRPRRSATGPWSIILNRLAEVWHLIAIFYVIALWLVWAVELRNGYVRLINFFLETAGIMIVARLAAIMLLGALDKARALPELARRLPGFEDRANAYYPILRTVVTVVIFVVTVVTLLEVWGLGVIDWFEGNGLGGKALSAVSLIAVTVFLAVLVWEGINAAIELHLTRLSESAQVARAGRLRTLLPMLRTTLLSTIVLVVALMTLDELGVNIAPLLAGAGVVGIAVGFGSQKLVQDLITGLFLLLENAMQVGDVVTLGGLSGTVEALSIRTIRLRALDGSVHIIPFSAVTTVTNQTRDYGYALLDVSVGLNEEPDRIVATLKQAADAMRKEPRWQNIVLEPLDVMGVEKFVDMAWIMRVRMKTQPSSRWAVARELNRRFKAVFDQFGIESPITSNRALSTIPAPPTPPEGGPA
jgi:small-conductance mechanosensitive channel